MTAASKEPVGEAVPIQTPIQIDVLAALFQRRMLAAEDEALRLASQLREAISIAHQQAATIQAQAEEIDALKGAATVEGD